MIKKEPENFVSDIGNIYQPSNTTDGFVSANLKNDTYVNFQDVNKTLESNSPVPMEKNNHVEEKEDLHKNKLESLYSSWSIEKELKQISDKCIKRTHENEEDQVRISNARKNICLSLHRCDLCQYYFQKIFDLKKHLLCHKINTSFRCDLCQRFYPRKRSLCKHLKYHLFKSSYCCHVCKKSFHHKYLLKQHH